MSVVATFAMSQPLKARMTLTVSMTLEEWNQVRKALPVENPPTIDYWHPALNLQRVIDEMVEKANKEFYAYGENAPEASNG